MNLNLLGGPPLQAFGRVGSSIPLSTMNPPSLSQDPFQGPFLQEAFWKPPSTTLLPLSSALTPWL